jgi:hypothetical protein
LRDSVRQRRRSVEDDRAEARIAVQEVKDIRARVKLQLQAHFPFSTLEQELLNNNSSHHSSSMSSQEHSDEDDDNDDEDDDDDDQRYD